MDLLKREDYAMLESQIRENQSIAKMNDSRLKWMKYVLDLILCIGISYYQEGCNIDYFTQSKVLIGHPSENPESKSLRTNLEIFE